jgi:lysophospholipase L1-like esterase
MRRPAALAAILFTTAALATAQQPKADPAKPFERKGTEKQHESFLKRGKEGPVDLLFVGDSITAGWNGKEAKKIWDERFGQWKPANFGIGGDRTEHVLWRITDGKELADIDPKVIVLMIGTNNTGSNSAEEIAGGVKAIVEEFKKQKPKAKVLLLSVFPRSKRAGNTIPKDEAVVPAEDLQPKIKEINDRIAKLDDGKNVFYLDIGGKFLNDKGGLPRATMPDYLHLSAAGYKIWADAIEKKLNELLK